MVATREVVHGGVRQTYLSSYFNGCYIMRFYDRKKEIEIGQAVAGITEIRSVAEIMRDIIAGYDRQRL